MTKLIQIFFICLGLSISVQAQVTPLLSDSVAVPIQRKLLYTNYLGSLGGNFLSGNSQNNSVASSFDFDFEWKNINLVVNNNYLFGKANGLKSFDDITSNILVELFPQKIIFPVLRFNALKSFSLKKDFEFSMMPSLGFNPGFKMHLPILFMAGLGYEKLSYGLPTLNGIRKFNLMRLNLGFNANELKMKKLGNVNFSVAYLPALKDFKNYRFGSNLQYAFPVSKRFSFLTNFIYNHENLVPVGIKPNQFITTFGLGLRKS
jgi:hypothetical protein